MSGVVTQNVLGNSGLVTAVVAGGAWTEIKSLTASCDATLDFVNGASDVVLDSTYPVYCFKFTSMHPETDDVEFMFNGSVYTGCNYTVTKTTTYFYAANFEGAGSPTVTYEAGRDLAQRTAFAELAGLIGNANDECTSGYLHLFDPSDTTYVKHFISKSSTLRYNERLHTTYTAGYLNNTSAVDAIQFKMSSGDMDLGKIKLFGIKDS